MNIRPDLRKPAILRQDYALEDRYHGADIFLTGTQALVRLPLEQVRLDRARGLRTAGVIAGYRGSPLGAYDQALGAAAALLREHDVRLLPAINEDLAATALIGTQEAGSDSDRTVDGVFGIWYGKGPGVDRAGDALKHGNALGASAKGGVLALLGDDHGCVSSSMPHQSDQALIGFMMPVLHPACIEDYIPFGLFGIAASRFSGAWVGMKTISEVLESGATVRVNQPADFTEPPFAPPAAGLHHDPVNNFGPVLEQRMLPRLDAFRAFAAANPLDRAAFGHATPKHAIVAVGKAYFDVVDALRTLGIDSRTAEALGLGIYKVGIAWPIEPAGFETFLADAEVVLVVEEKRAVVEPQLKDLFFNRPEARRPVIVGKRDRDGAALLPDGGEMRPSRLIPVLRRAFGLACDGIAPAGQAHDKPAAPAPLHIARRIPFFCSGCPHNRSTKVPAGSKAMPGIGCHYMASWMDRDTGGIVQMGGEGVNWVGWAPFTSRRHVFQNLGDGTYFHSGLMAIRQAISAKANITYKILFNDAVAMTGGQPVDGPLSVEAIIHQVHGEGIQRIAVLSENPERFGRGFPFLPGVTLDHRDRLDAIQAELRATEGVTVLIYDQGCAAEKRRKRKKGALADPGKRVFISPSVCEGCGDCSVQSNCMSVVPVASEWGVKRAIDQASCNKDFSCVKGFCPSFVTVTGEELPDRGDAARRAALLDRAGALAEPAVPAAARILVTGIGGTGVVTIGAVLAMAAHLEGKTSSVLDFMGFAQKGGSVISHLKIAPHLGAGEPVRIDTGSADVLLGCDMVVATMADAIDMLSPDRSRIVVNRDVLSTAEFVMRGVADFQGPRRLDMLAGRARAFDTIAATSTASQLFGDSVFANMLLTGFAWQKGLLPLSRASIQRAIDLNGRAAQSNREAFEIGRLAAADPAALAESDQAPPEPRSLDDLIQSRGRFLATYANAAYAARFRDFVETVRRAEAAVGSTALTRAVAANLSRLMAIKDEYEVARLLLDDTDLSSIRARFAGGGRLSFNFAPPFLAFLRDGNGRPRKFAIPGWLALPVLRLLRALRPLRGTPLDAFGWSAERRAERRLVQDYRALIERLLDGLDANTLEGAARIAGLADRVRGYGPVKRAAIAAYTAELAVALEQFGTTRPPQRAASAG